MDIGWVEGGRHLPGLGRLVLLFGCFRWINHVLLLFYLFKLLKTSLGCIAAIHQDRTAGHEAGIIRSKPDKRFGDFFRCGEALQGMEVSQFRALLLVGGTNHRRLHITWAQCHDTDMVSTKLQGGRFGKTKYAMLGCDIGRSACLSNSAKDRSHVDHRAASLLQELL